MFRSAIVKKPCKNFSQGLTTSSLGFPDYEKVLEQHENYIKTLRKCGLEVHILNADENYRGFADQYRKCENWCGTV